jgi:hypothetical protein
LLLGCSARASAGIEDAAAAYRENRVAEAEAILSHLIADPTSSEADRARALRIQAGIAWLIDADLPRALEAISRAEAIGGEQCETAMAKARLLDQGGRGTQLLSESDALAARCTEKSQVDEVRLETAQAALDLAAGAGDLRAALPRAQLLLASLGEDGASGLQGSALRLQWALLAGDADQALQAWKDYFWLRGRDLPQGLDPRFGPGTERFQRGLARGASVEDRLHLLDLLVRAGFAQAAERFATAAGLPRAAAGNPIWTRAQAYFEARRQLEADLQTVNRRIARDGPSRDVLGAWDRAAVRLVQAAGGGDRAAVLRSAYGLYWTIGRTGGFPSIHLGHIVEDRRETVQQYGHRAEVSFLVVDNMIANGFQSWLWNGEAATGGWTEEGPVIVQVRPGYTSDPLSAWHIASGGAARQRILERQAQRAAADLAAAALRGSPAGLPGLTDRLRLQVIDQIYGRVQASGAVGDELKRAFLEEYVRATFQHSIMIHEGRHAIDRAVLTGLARTDEAVLEYRAKLSELALADFPRLALQSILGGGIGGNSSHGDANAHILTDFVAWIEGHRDQVPQFDAGQPAMVQIDRLTNDQIQTIAKGLDPLAQTAQQQRE